MYHPRMGSERTFLYEIAGGAHIAVHKEAAPTDGEWKAYLNHIAEHFDEVRGLIVHAPSGAGPNVNQRGMATAHWDGFGRAPQIAIMTSSALLKGAATALSWFLGKKLKAFGPDDYSGVGSYLGLTAAEVEVARATVDKLRKQLDEI